jgi:hypothetical protein
MTLCIPSLDEELSRPLQEIVEDRKFDKYKDDLWKKELLPKIISRLDLIVEMSKTGEQYGKRPQGVELHKAISDANVKICRHIEETFQNGPPYTILRLAELLLDSGREGYHLINNVEILKYLNSLCKVVLVSSEILDFPPTTFLSEESLENTELIEPFLRGLGKGEKTSVPIETRESKNTEPIKSDSSELRSSDPEFESSDPQTLRESELNGLKRLNISNESVTKRMKGNETETETDDSNGTTSEENDSTRKGNDIDRSEV